MLDLSQGDRLTFSAVTALVLQVNLWEMVSRSTPRNIAVLLILLGFSIFSWTIIFARWSTFGRARRADTRFLRAFRKATALDAVMVASEQVRSAPPVSVFDLGYEEVCLRVVSRGS